MTWPEALVRIAEIMGGAIVFCAFLWFIVRHMD